MKRYPEMKRLNACLQMVDAPKSVKILFRGCFQSSLAELEKRVRTEERRKKK